MRPTEIELALTPSDVLRIAKSGKKVAVIGIENGYPIGTDIGRVKEFRDRGGRYLSLAHNGHSQLADSNTGEANNQWMWGGLSPLGKQVIEEMNRWGIMVDVSHPSKGAVMQAMALSKAPVIASHSAVRTLANVSRNMDDEMLMALKTNGGVIQIVGFAGYLKASPPERGPAITALQREFGVASTAARGDVRAGAGDTIVSGRKAWSTDRADAHEYDQPGRSHRRAPGGVRPPDGGDQQPVAGGDRARRSRTSSTTSTTRSS